MPTQFAIPFGDFAVDEEEATRKSRIRQAFNSPFWPFILATTSVGQEGLDFHLYCSDILHWNLPSNPVEIEQREGRINRYNSLYIRRALAQVYAAQSSEPGANPWDAVFAAACREQRIDERSTLELFPHWIHVPRRGSPLPCGIKRIVLPYPYSAEVQKYNFLIESLVTYRIAIGQPRQEELLREMRPGDIDLSDLRRQCRRLMLDLRPFDMKVYRGLARAEAERILAKPAPECGRLLAQLMDEAKEILRTHPGIRPDFAARVRQVLDRIRPEQLEAQPDRQKCLVAALIYLINPFDEIPDDLGEDGFVDDDRVVQEALSG